MRKFEFLDVYLDKFCNYIDPMEIEIIPNTLNLIVGPNGCGKTNIFEGIYWTLYGMTSKGLRGEEVVNDRIGKNCHTRVRFKLNDIVYSVERYCKHSKHGTTVYLFRENDDKPYKKGQNEVRQEIEKLLTPAKLFTNILFFPQKVNTFFTDLTDSEQKEIFRKIIGLDDYVMYQKETKNKIESCRSVVSSLQNDILVSSKILDSCREKISVLKNEKFEFYKQKELEIKKISEILESLLENIKKQEEIIKSYNQINYEDLLKNVDEKLEKEKSSLNEINILFEKEKQKVKHEFVIKKMNLKNDSETEKKKLLEEKNNKISILKESENKEILKLTEQISSYKNEIVSISSENLLFNNKIEHLNSEIENITKNVINNDVPVCPTCYQTISSETIETLKQQVYRYTEDIGEYNKEIKNNENKIKELESIIVCIKDEVKSISSKSLQEINEISANYQRDISLIDNNLNLLISEIEELEKNTIKNIELMFHDKITGLKETIEKLNSKKKSILQIQSERDIEQKKLDNLLKDFSLKERELNLRKDQEYNDNVLNSYINDEKELKHKINLIKSKFEKESEFLNILEFWWEAFSSSGIPSMLIDESIPFMNERVMYYLEQICGGRYIVSFDTLKETKSGEFRDKISVNVLDTQTMANSRLKLSGGQTRIVDIATILMLSDLQSLVQNIKINLMLFDEIFDSLDETNIEYVSKILRLLSKEKTIYVISHTQINQLEADNIINIMN